MSWPKPVDALWRDLESVRAELLREVEGLSQRQAEWRPTPRDWSVGEVIDHLTIAEIATGKLTTKLTKEVAPTGFPADLAEFAELPVSVSEAANAPESVWPTHGKSLPELIATLKATRALRFKHFRLGELDLAQWWRLAAEHDRVHLGQVRDVKRAPGFPAA